MILKLTGYAFLIFIAYVLVSVNMGWDLFIFKWVDYVPFKDKTVHFLLIGLLAFFANIIFDLKKIKLFNSYFLLGSVCVFVFITIEEASQYFLANRNCELYDLMANYAGIFVFGKLTFLVEMFRKKSTSNSLFI